MPELPEVETVLKTLEHMIGYDVIKDVVIKYDKLIAEPSVAMFKERIIGQHFRRYKRLGKYLMFELDQDVLVVHLRMEGKFYIQDKDAPFDEKHTHAIFYLEQNKVLLYHDTRKFGRMYLYDKSYSSHIYPALKNVGYDAFDPHLNASYLYNVTRNKKVSLKRFLLDQHYIAGIGNIYANEICFRLGFHPGLKVCRLTKKDFEALLVATRTILAGAIKAGGTTIRSYTSSLGVDGKFQLQLKVHGRENEPCVVCSRPIVKEMMEGRGTYYCKECQKKK